MAEKTGDGVAVGVMVGVMVGVTARALLARDWLFIDGAVSKKMSSKNAAAAPARIKMIRLMICLRWFKNSAKERVRNSLRKIGSIFGD